MRYTATAERDGSVWLIHVPAVERDTQARSLREAPAMAVDLVAVMHGVDPETVEIDLDVWLPDSVRGHLAQAERLRQDAAEANRRAAAESRQAARELRESGLTVRDIGKALGVSYQRAHQLVG